MTIEHLYDLLLWMTIINLGLFSFSIGIILYLQSWIIDFHSRLFGLTKEKVSLSLYKMMGIYKILIIIFNIVPLIALEIIR